MEKYISEIAFIVHVERARTRLRARARVCVCVWSNARELCKVAKGRSPVRDTFSPFLSGDTACRRRTFVCFTDEAARIETRLRAD